MRSIYAYALKSAGLNAVGEPQRAHLQAYDYRTYSTTEDDQLEKDRLLKLDKGASLLQLDNDLFSKKTHMASWDGNRCGAFSTSNSSSKMTR